MTVFLKKPISNHWKRLLALCLGIALLAAGPAFPDSAPKTETQARTKTEQSDKQPAIDNQQILADQDTRPIARVGDTRIPHWMFDNAMADRLGRNWQIRDLPENVVNTARKEILDNLVHMALLENAARESGISLSDGAGALRTKVVEGSFKNRQAFLDALARAGMTEKQYIRIWQQQAVVNMFIQQELESGVTVREKEVKALFRQRKAKQPDRIAAYADIQEQLAEDVKRKKTRDKLDAFIEGLKETVLIEIYDR
jgi:hypothetical protein